MPYVARSKLVVGVVALALSVASIRPLQAQRVPRPTHVTAPWTTGASADALPEDSGCAREAEARAGTHWFAGCNSASQWARSPGLDQLDERPNGWLIAGASAAVGAAFGALGFKALNDLYDSGDANPLWKGAGVGALGGVALGLVICAYHGGCSWPPFSHEPEVSWATTTGRGMALSIGPAHADSAGQPTFERREEHKCACSQ